MRNRIVIALSFSLMIGLLSPLAGTGQQGSCSETLGSSILQQFLADFCQPIQQINSLVRNENPLAETLRSATADFPDKTPAVVGGPANGTRSLTNSMNDSGAGYHFLPFPACSAILLQHGPPGGGGGFLSLLLLLLLLARSSLPDPAVRVMVRK